MIWGWIVQSRPRACTQSFRTMDKTCLMCSCDRTPKKLRKKTWWKSRPGDPQLQVSHVQAKHPNTMHAIILWSEGLSVAKTIPSENDVTMSIRLSEKGFHKTMDQSWINMWQHCMLLTKVGTFSIWTCQNNAMLDGVGDLKRNPESIVFLERHLLYIDATNLHICASHWSRHTNFFTTNFPGGCLNKPFLPSKKPMFYEGNLHNLLVALHFFLPDFELICSVYLFCILTLCSLPEYP